MEDEREVEESLSAGGPPGERTVASWRAAMRTPSFTGSHLQRLKSMSSRKMVALVDEMQAGTGGVGEGGAEAEEEGKEDEEDEVSEQDWRNYYDHEVNLNGAEFLRSMVWEFVGPILNIPLIMLMVGRKWQFVAVNRAFWPHEDGLTPIFIMTSIFQILRIIAVYFVASGMVDRSDFEWRLYLFILLGWIVRAMIVSFKYAFMCKRDVKDNYKRAPKWSPDRTNRGLIGAGWMDPRRWGVALLSRACQEAMVLEDVDLTNVRVTCTYAKAVMAARKHLYRNALVQGKLPTPEESAGGPLSSSAGIVDPADDGEDGTVPVYALLEHIMYTHIGEGMGFDSKSSAGRYQVFIVLFVMPLVIPVTRAFYDLPAYGTGDPAREFVYAEFHLSVILTLIFVMSMPWNMAHDYARRANAMEALGSLGDAGITSADLFQNHPPEMLPAEEGVSDPRDVHPSHKVFPEGVEVKADEGQRQEGDGPTNLNEKKFAPPVDGRPILECLGLTGDEIIKVSLRESSTNAFGFMLARRVLFSLGERFKRRFQAMSLVMYAFSLALVVLLCVMLYTRTSHRIEFMNLCVLTVCIINVPICATILAAMRLSLLTPKHKEIMMKDQFSVECENAACENELANLFARAEEQSDLGIPVDGSLRKKIRDLQLRGTTLRGASSVLGVASELLSYHEEHCNPTTVLGVHANSPFAVVAALSTLGAGIALLLQSGTDNLAAGYGYDEFGVYSPDVGQLY